MKRVTALILATLMLVMIFSGCQKSDSSSSTTSTGSSESSASTTSSESSASATSDESSDSNPYAEKITFTVYSLDDSDDFMNWPLVKEAKEKFNFDFTIQQVAWDNWDETTRTLAATDSLPEVLAWYNLQYSEYKSWSLQGVLKALPDDMSSYPNLQKLMDEHDIFNKLKIDGKLYAFPKINNNNPYNNYTPYLFINRNDWASEMGKNFSPVEKMSWEEFVSYLKEIKEKDPAGLGDKLVPLDPENGGLDWYTLVSMWNPYLNSYKKDSSGKYVWGADDPSSLVGIQKIKELYDAGLLAKDSYADKMESGQERFLAGRSAILSGPYGPSLLQDTVYAGLKSNDSSVTEEDLNLLAITIDGKYPVQEITDWWAAFAFSNKCSDEQMNRFLAVGNWLLDEEQIEKYAYGIPGEDWTKSDSGEIMLNYNSEDTIPGASKAYIKDQALFQKFFILEGLDIWLPGNPNVSDYLVNDCYKTFLKTQEEAPDFTPHDYDYDFFSGTYKDQYGTLTDQIQAAVIQAVVSDDPEQTWNQFLNDNRATAQLVIDELNSALAK